MEQGENPVIGSKTDAWYSVGQWAVVIILTMLPMAFATYLVLALTISSTAPDRGLGGMVLAVYAVAAYVVAIGGIIFLYYLDRVTQSHSRLRKTVAVMCLCVPFVVYGIIRLHESSARPSSDTVQRIVCPTFLWLPEKLEVNNPWAIDSSGIVRGDMVLESPWAQIIELHVLNPGLAKWEYNSVIKVPLEKGRNVVPVLLKPDKLRNPNALVRNQTASFQIYLTWPVPQDLIQLYAPVLSKTNKKLNDYLWRDSVTCHFMKAYTLNSDNTFSIDYDNTRIVIEPAQNK